MFVFHILLYQKLSCLILLCSGVTGGDNEIAQELLSNMKDLLGNKFLNIDFKSLARNVNDSDWSRVTSCRRSDSGTIGIYFIQSSVAPTHQISQTKPAARNKSPAKISSTSSESNKSNHPPEISSMGEIIVAKPVSKEDFERQFFVNEMIKEYFKIHCPSIRFISKTDDEFKHLEDAVKKLFLPFHGDLYSNGGM